jgi:hypothetical protein
MFFTRTHQYNCPISQDDFKNRLIGKHVKIHNLDFEVFEKDQMLSIIPHAEQLDAITTLPITRVMFKPDGDKTNVVITSKMRKIDVGGPQIIMIICGLLLTAAAILYGAGIAEPVFSYGLLAAAILIFGIFWMRLERGYFDYIRKIRDYVKNKAVVA